MGSPSADIIALVALGVLVLIMRWVFAPSRPHARAAQQHDATDAPDLGLLSVIASALPRQTALAQRARLQDAGIRSSMSRRKDGTMDVLVFHADIDKARALLDT